MISNPGLKNVVIMEHTPRFDVHEADPTALKPKLAMYANTVLADLHKQSVFQDRIILGKHGLDMEGSKMGACYRDAHNKSVIETMKRMLSSSVARSSFLSSTTASNYHTTCPQAQYQKTQRLKMNNIYNIPIRNQFEVLGNWEQFQNRHN